MNPAILQYQFVQVAPPIMVTLLTAGWMNGKGLDGINRRLDDIVSRLGRIEDDLKKQLATHGWRTDRIGT
jgi:hypothetical protein